MRLTRNEALKIRAILEEAMQTTALSDQKASQAPTLFPSFKSLLKSNKTFTQEDVNNRFRFIYNNKMYVVIQPHTMQENWTPDTAISLYETIDYVDGIRIIQTYITSANPFSKDEIGIDANGIKWRSLVDFNVYTPEQYANNWEQIED